MPGNLLRNVAQMDEMRTALTFESAGRSSSYSMSIVKPNPDFRKVRIMKLSEHKAAALSLAEAFEKDDVSRYFIDTPDTVHWTAAKKWRLHLRIFEYVVFAHCINGLVLTAGPEYGCVALWLPPGQSVDGLRTIVRSGTWRLKYKLSVEGKARYFTEFLPLLHDTKAEILGRRGDDSWVLNYIGTKPVARGMGYARQCIEYVTRMADAQNHTCYLESSNGINPAIYSKLGFEAKMRIYLTRESVPIELDCMVREPRKITIVRRDDEEVKVEDGLLTSAA